MYEQHFGLNKRPFSTIAAGPDVFVGPQTAKAMAALKKALDVPDAVAVVTGPVGVGKTTLVNRGLQAIGQNRIIISVARMQLDQNDVLELLLDRLGLKQMPASTVQRFLRFRRLLHALAERNTRVFIVVEDAVRIGRDTLAELEALTASDTGASDGANIVLMGEPDVNELIKAPQLARMKQRIRLRESIAALSNSEMRAYLKHSFRQAGGDFNGIFDENTSDLLHQHSEGIPRVVNNMVETVLEYASERKISRVTATFLTSVITDECGIADQTPSHNLAQTDAADAVTKSEQTPDSASTTKSIEESESESEFAPDAKTEPLEPANKADDGTPEIALVNDTHVPAEIVDITMPEADADEDEDSLPELIQDTFPSLAALKPELIDTRLPSESISALAPETTDSPLPELAPELAKNKDIESVIVNSELPNLDVGDKARPTLEKPEDDDGIPMLSNSMRLESPNFDASPEDAPIDVMISKSTPQDESLPSADANGIEHPECDSEPEIAELQPDLEALERAMAITQGSVTDLNSRLSSDAGLSSGDSTSGHAARSSLPEITLDKAIQDKIAEATELLERSTHDLAEVAAEGAKIAADAAALKSARATDEPAIDNAELTELSSEVANLKTIEDVDDKMGETLFGDEFSNMAAQIAAHVAENPLPETSANDDAQPNPLSAELIEARSPAVVAESVVMGSELLEIAETEPDANTGGSEAALERRFVTVTPVSERSETTPADSESVTLSEEPLELEKTMTTKSLASMNQQGPIEDQINISMTQTLKALNVSPPAIDDVDDDDSDKVVKGGFFSRFRRS